MADTQNKVLNTRIKLKYDSYANWQAATDVVLLKGEVAICEIPGTTTTVKDENGKDKIVTTAPTVLFKVGTYDGADESTKKSFSQLPWASAKAADVHEWAKLSWEEFCVELNTYLNTEKWVDLSGSLIQGEGDETPTTIVSALERAATYAAADVLENARLAAGDEGVTSAFAELDVEVRQGVHSFDSLVLAHKTSGVTEGTYGGNGGSATEAGKTVDIVVPQLTVNPYGHVTGVEDKTYTVKIPEAVVDNDTKTEVTAGNGIVVTPTIDGENRSYEVAHAVPTTVASDETTGGRTYINSITFDDFGHVTSIETGTETVVDTNTAHTHANGSGTVVTAAGGTDEGDVKVDLNVALELINRNVVLYDKSDSTKTPIASLNADAFIKDGMIQEVNLVDADAEGNPGKFLEIIWNTDAGIQTTYVDLATLIDVYTAGTGLTLEGREFRHADTSNVANVTKTARTYISGITFDDFGHVTAVETGVEVDQDLTHNHDTQYKAIQTPVTDVTVNENDPATLEFISSVTQDAQGVITATKKTVDLSNYYNKSEIDDKFEALDSDIAATDEVDNKVSVLTGISQTDGKLTGKTETTLAAIAKTGKVQDLIQDANTYIVFDCGSASTVI